MAEITKIYYAGARLSNIFTGGQRRIANVLEYCEKQGAEIVYLEEHKSFRNVLKIPYLVSSLWYALQFFRIDGTGKTLVLEDYSQRFHLIVFNFLLWLTKRVRIVCLTNAFYFSYRRSVLKNRLDWIISKLFFRTVDLIVVGGEAAKGQLTHLGTGKNSRIHTIYPALRTEFIENGFKKSFGRSKGSIHLLSVGRLHPIKGVEYLLEAVKSLDHKDVKLTIVGDYFYLPKYTADIKQKIRTLSIEDRVALKGEIKDAEQLLKVYNQSDIFVMPSLWETSPIVIVEAMSVGLPVVATHVGGIPEWVEDGTNGILVPPKDSVKLADAIDQLVKDAALREAMGQKGYEKSLGFRNRTWEDVGREYYALFMEVF